MARMRPVLFSSTTAAPCTCGRTRSSTRVPCFGPGPVARQLDVDHVVGLRAAPRVRLPQVESGRMRPSRKPDADRFVAAASAAPSRPRPPASNARRRAAAAPAASACCQAGLVLSAFGSACELLDRVGEVGFGALELDAAGALLVAREPVLQRGLGRALQLRLDGRAHRRRMRGQAVDAGERLGLAADLVDEVEAGVAPRPRRSATIASRSASRLLASARR